MKTILRLVALAALAIWYMSEKPNSTGSSSAHTAPSKCTIEVLNDNNEYICVR